MKSLFRIGFDIGSTTIKCVVLNEKGKIEYSSYERHYSRIREVFESLLKQVTEKLPEVYASINITGSGGMALSQLYSIDFVQEVIAATKAVQSYHPETDVVIELGGEDAKIIYLTGGIEQRMNGTCAGGTGSFIDQMASLLNTDASGLDKLAEKAENIYPIAARCGVFAKTDIQPLLNEGVAKTDIASSIFQAVVIQTISGLACGRPIKGKVAFLGGPLHFLRQLGKRFEKTLKLNANEAIYPENAELFIALGAALSSSESSPVNLGNLKRNEFNIVGKQERDTSTLEPLFSNDEELALFKQRHSTAIISRNEIKSYSGPCFLGIDAGSTTTKIALVDKDGNMLLSHYGSNEGKPLRSTIKALRSMLVDIPENAWIASSCVTGYGEELIKKALRIDHSEIETVAHFKAADFFNPGVDFILDIGGQDMKCLQIKDGIIDSILLNEACSSGCGSFLETFSASLGMNIVEFTNAALSSRNPVDLGSRCTVFMNSRVKQAQKEGYNVSDIAAGLTYSVIKNALYKVIKLRSSEDLGEKVVLQGGTFYNDAVLRSFEKLTGKEAVRPDIAGIMGAFGACLIAMERSIQDNKSNMLSIAQLDELKVETDSARCGKCTNKCYLTITRFSDGERHITGNRCENGIGEKIAHKNLPNMFDYKYERLFNYKTLSLEEAIRGTIGIPRVLNMYENYPFWVTFFNHLKFKVVLSDHSSKEIYERGIESIPSESVCYPAKLVHGHVQNLIDKGIKTIFYPAIMKEKKEFTAADNHFNCPIVTSYPEVIKANLESIRNNGIKYMMPFLPYDNPRKMASRLYHELKEFKVQFSDVYDAVREATKELHGFKDDIREKGEQILRQAKDEGFKSIVLAGRPYHIDPMIHHGIPQYLNKLGFAVLTEDSTSHLSQVQRPLRVVDQWAYHSRLYSSAEFTTKQKNVELVQLNSFGCGIDAITTDQVQEILKSSGKTYTSLKIDEGTNLGSVKIRLRSLKAALDERDKKPRKITVPEIVERPIFTQDMANTHTILAPQMSPIHFRFVEKAFNASGYKLAVLDNMEKSTIDEGLKYVNNDACYPAIIVIGQVIEALKSGRYDTQKVSVIISQTGGGCRATNYIGLLKKALKESGFGNVPVLSLSTKGFDKHPGFKVNMSLLNRAMMGLVYGDILMRLLYRVRPYEKVKSSANELYEAWTQKCLISMEKASPKSFAKNIRDIVKDFENFEIFDNRKPKVGLVGEILVKFHPTANNNIVNFLEEQGTEAVVPDLMDFFSYSFYNADFRYKFLSDNKIDQLTGLSVVAVIDWYRREYVKALKTSQRFEVPKSIKQIAHGASKILSLGNQTGEGWFLTGEMVELLESNVRNIVCMQPFACLPNHVTGKGMIKQLKRVYPNSNIVAIDYDPGASEVNQLNRIKLMLTNAFEYDKPTEREVKSSGKLNQAYETVK